MVLSDGFDELLRKRTATSLERDGGGALLNEVYADFGDLCYL